MADIYDSPWKEAIEAYFEPFLAFYFSDAHAQIDWSADVVFLEQELRSAMHDVPPESSYVDKLARVTRKGGEPGWVYVHLEVQGEQQTQFPARMFRYHSRLYERYQQPVASLALLTDDSTHWRPERFGYEMFGCRLLLEFPTAKLLDWAGNEAMLEDSDNPFAIVTLTHLNTRATRHDMDERKAAKRELLKNLFRRGWEREQVGGLLRVIDWMMRLPDALEVEIRQDMQRLEEGMGTPYVTSFERFARIEGREEGLHEGQARLLTRLLERRFGELPDWVLEKLGQATDAEVELWADAVLTAESFNAVFEADS